MTKFLITILLSLFINNTYSKDPLLVGGILSMPAPPFNWIDTCASPKMTGTVFHMLRKIFSELNIPYKFDEPQQLSFEFITSNHKKLRSGEYDALLSVFKHSETEDMLLSEHPIAVIKDAAVFYKQRLPNINTPLDLKPYTGAALKIRGAEDRKSIKWLKQYDMKYKLYPSMLTAMEALHNKEVDYIIGQKIDALSNLITEEQKSNITVMAIDTKSRDFYFAMSPRSPWANMFPEIDQKITEFQTSEIGVSLRYTYLKNWLHKDDCIKK